MWSNFSHSLDLPSTININLKVSRKMTCEKRNQKTLPWKTNKFKLSFEDNWKRGADKCKTKIQIKQWMKIFSDFQGNNNFLFWK